MEYSIEVKKEIILPSGNKGNNWWIFRESKESTSIDIQVTPGIRSEIDLACKKLSNITGDSSVILKNKILAMLPPEEKAEK